MSTSATGVCTWHLPIPVLSVITPTLVGPTVWGKLCSSARRLHTRTHLSSVLKTNQDSSLKTTFCQFVTFHIAQTLHHCRRSRRYSSAKERVRKGRLDFRFASARRLEIVFITTAIPTSAFIVERITVGSTSACRTILRSSVLVVFLVALHFFCVHGSQHFLCHTPNDPPDQPQSALTSL